MKEISVSKRNLVIAVILGVVLAVGILVIEHWPIRIGQGPTAIMPDEKIASQAAISSVEKIFQIDYRSSKDDWLKRICETSTKAGCDLIKAGSERMWAKYVDDKSIVTAEVQPIQKVAANGKEQVWQLAISLSSPLPGSNKTEDIAYVALMKSDNAWLFDRFLMQAEIDAILSRQLTTTPSAGCATKF